MLIVSCNDRYLVYTATRRRYITTDCTLRGDFTDPAELITDNNLIRWTGVGYYKVDTRVEPKSLTYVEAVEYTQDRYDMNAGMRQLMTPSRALSDLPRSVRNELGYRIDRAINNHIRRLDPENYRSASAMTEAHAVFKGGHYYMSVTFMRVRNAFREFGHMVAHFKAGGDKHTIEDIRDAFFDLDNHYHDLTAPMSHAHEAAREAAEHNCEDLEIVACDCGHYERDGDEHDVRGDTWCEACFNEDAVYVVDVDEYWPRDDAYYSESRDAYYSYDRDYEESDDDDDDDDNPIMSYSTNVLHVLGNECDIRSSHFGEFTMGIELEMTSGDAPCDSAAESVRSRLGNSYCIIKHDGSLPHNGFEVVTVPHSLATHIAKFKAWDIDPAYRAWNTGKCGMHIHIDSRAFTQLTLGKFLMFINSNGNVEFIRKIAGRHPSVDDQARSYCAAEHQSILTNPKQAVKGKSGERYRMVNMMNLGSREALRLGLSMDNSYNGKYNTVELRIFRASLKKERLLAQIEFTHASVMFCRVASWRDLNGTSFVKWLKTVAGQYPALVKWYGVRNVHTSTPTVIAPAEVTCTDAVPPVVPRDYRFAHGQNHGYHLVVPHNNGRGMREYASNNGLYFTYFRCATLQLMLAVFPYSGDETTIGDDDVIYVLDVVDNVWNLQEDDFNAIIREHNPVQADVSATSI
jgi:hypothetical protein